MVVEVSHCIDPVSSSKWYLMRFPIITQLFVEGLRLDNEVDDDDLDHDKLLKRVTLSQFSEDLTQILDVKDDLWMAIT